jgi:hypothetical protein
MIGAHGRLREFDFVSFEGKGVVPRFGEQRATNYRENYPGVCFPEKLSFLDLRDAETVDNVVVEARGVARLVVSNVCCDLLIRPIKRRFDGDGSQAGPNGDDTIGEESACAHGLGPLA